MAEHTHGSTSDKGKEWSHGTSKVKGGAYNDINEGNAAQGVTDEKSGSGAPQIEEHNPRGKK